MCLLTASLYIDATVVSLSITRRMHSFNCTNNWLLLMFCALRYSQNIKSSKTCSIWFFWSMLVDYKYALEKKYIKTAKSLLRGYSLLQVGDKFFVIWYRFVTKRVQKWGRRWLLRGYSLLQVGDEFFVIWYRFVTKRVQKWGRAVY